MTGISSFSASEYSDDKFNGLEHEYNELRNKEFYDCVFLNCSFQETLFYGCKFDGCLFEDCNLNLVKVTNSAFSSIEFRKCQLMGIDWTVSDWSRLGIIAPISFFECSISHSIFMGLKLNKVKIVRSMAENVDFSEADLTGADCSYTDFLAARFQQTDLTGVNFEMSSNYAIDVYQNTIKKARFSLPEAVSLLNSLDIVLVD